MEISMGRAPSRISLAGGGTDLPAWYERNGGAVVSFTIDLYAYAHVEPRSAGLELVSMDTGSRELIGSKTIARRMRPPILAEEFLVYQAAVASHFGIERGRLAVTSEIPAGVGLASSGAVCVALVEAAARAVGEDLDRAAIAESAFRIDSALLRRVCGKQDQYASAFGGFNLIEFFKDGSVDVTPLKVAPSVLRTLESRVMLFHDGSRRSAVGPLTEQARRSTSDPDTVRALNELKDMAYVMRETLEKGDLNRVGALLDQGWQAKQHLNSQVSTPSINRVYALARRAGATGGKLSGAGLGGTIVLYCPEERQDEVRLVMASQGWRERSVKFDREGAAPVPEVGDETAPG
jgi:D-glycero-alpha-D-manno-heptose-7-phosphate kinase